MSDFRLARKFDLRYYVRNPRTAAVSIPWTLVRTYYVFIRNSAHVKVLVFLVHRLRPPMLSTANRIPSRVRPPQKTVVGIAKEEVIVFFPVLLWNGET